MKLLKNRTFLGVGSIVLALIICLIVAPTLNTAASKQVDIVRVVKNIPAGTAVTKDMVQTVKVGGYNLPSNILKSDKDVVGKYTAAALQTGDYILNTKISNQAPGAYLTELDGKKQAISISIKSFAAGLSGKLESGDVISLIASDYGDLKETIAPSELRYVKLLAATNNTGTDNTGDQSVKDKTTQEDMPSTLTLLVTPEQSKKLVDFETNGKLHAALVYRGTTESANKFLDMQDQYLSSITAKEDTSQGQNTTGTGGTTVHAK